jgi:hypothetical protein
MRVEQARDASKSNTKANRTAAFFLNMISSSIRNTKVGTTAIVRLILPPNVPGGENAR